MATRQKRTITADEKKMFLGLKSDDITQTLFDDLFTDKLDTTKQVKDPDTGKMVFKIIPSKFNTFDEIPLKKGEYFNKEDIVTNCGLFIFNKFLIEPYFQKEVGYVNFEITKKGLGKIDDMVADAIMLDETGECVRKYIEYMNRLCWLAFTVNTQICSSLNLKTVKPLPKVMARKKQLLAENKEAIANNDAIAYKHIEDELVDIAKEELKDDPAYELYASGARGAFDNAYRQWLCSKGPIWNASRGEFEIVINSLYEGIPKENIPSLANAVVSGFYPKAIGTGECGYITKKLSAGFQDVVLDERGTDCKTKQCATVTLDKTNMHYYLYHFIKSGDKYIRLEPSNQDKYMNKTVQIRLPEYCIGKKLCNCCAGDRYYLLGIKTIGLTFGRVSNSTLRAKMKKSHDSTVRTYTLKPDKIFI
jgi:hypothetical protein